jgi:hypothetical protein
MRTTMATEAQVVIWYDGPMDREELEAAIQRRYPDAVVLEFEEEEV